MKKLFPIYMALIGLLLAILSCSMWKTVHCPPNDEPVQILKNPDKAYPAYAKTYNASIEATRKTADSVENRFGAGIESAVVKLRNDLDQESSQVQMILKTAIIGLQTTPCDTISRREFSILVNQVNERGVKIAELNDNLKRAIAAGDTSGIKNSINATASFIHDNPPPHAY
jgi:hypothetical protein